jgi:hypothetical protein
MPANAIESQYVDRGALNDAAQMYFDPKYMYWALHDVNLFSAYTRHSIKTFSLQYTLWSWSKFA